jgi:nitric oxide reductase NorQ protein
MTAPALPAGGDAHRLDTEPWYLPLADEVRVFEAAYQARLPVLLKGPTGCGKTRFVEHMAWRLYRQADTPRRALETPLITVACHEDLTASDLVGRYLLSGNETVWVDGALTRAVRSGAICYLDEVVEARKDTTVVVHSLTDHRRMLPIEKTGELLDAHPDFLLVISYNPGYQSVLKDLKPSTRQRFVTLEFDYPDVDVEAAIVAHEGGVEAEFAHRLARIGQKVRHLREHGFEEGVSTRLLVYAAQLVASGVEPRRACDAAIVRAVTDDREVQRAIADIVDVLLP